MPRVLLLLPTTTYRTEDFVAAAARQGVDVTIASEEASTLQALNPAGLLTLNFADPADAARQALCFAAEHPIDAVVAADSQAVVVAATICEALGLPSNSIESAAAAQNKYRMRELLMRGGVPTPRFRLAHFDEDPKRLAEDVGFPCVIKPLSLAASQGVMRVDDEQSLIPSVQRLKDIVADLQRHDARSCFLAEDFVAGPEFALEGILTRGRLRTLALFDKPDPLDGPYFEETIYITPSRLPAEKQDAIAQCTERAAQAIGLSHGPLHAELRLAGDGPVVIEVNPRSIGGLCSRTLRFGTGLSLEELIIRHALDPDFELPPRDARAAGVMMIPIPRAGVLLQVDGLSDAESVTGVEQVKITARLGQQLTPLPEGSRYLGFIFARGPSPHEVEQSLRRSHACLSFHIGN